MYKIELQEQEQLIDKLKVKADQDEELQYELKKQVQVLNETENLIPTLKTKVGDFEKDLREYLTANETTANEEEIAEAKLVLANAEKI